MGPFFRLSPFRAGPLPFPPLGGAGGSDPNLSPMNGRRENIWAELEGRPQAKMGNARSLKASQRPVFWLPASIKNNRSHFRNSPVASARRGAKPIRTSSLSADPTLNEQFRKKRTRSKKNKHAYFTDMKALHRQGPRLYGPELA